MGRKGVTSDPKKIKQQRKTKVVNYRYVIDCSIPVKDGIFDLNAFHKYLQSHYKVEGKVGNLGTKTHIYKKDEGIKVNTQVKIQKRYLKYLTKKYLKKENLRDWLHVVGTDKETFQLRYFQITQEEQKQE
eukprot:gene8403-228_t